jgi:hypothetical protein
MDEKKTRIGRRVREAIRLMVEERLKRSEAAERAGLKDNSLYVAMTRPDVCAYRNGLMKALRESEASRSVGRVADLADNSNSDYVKLGANTLLLGIQGIVPPARVEGRIEHTHAHLMPGLVINLIDREPVQIIDIDGRARVIERPKVNRLRERVPHPSELKPEDER